MLAIPALLGGKSPYASVTGLVVAGLAYAALPSRKAARGVHETLVGQNV